MIFAIYLPPQAKEQPVPVLYWLSGLTCTDENFMQKAGAQRVAAELGIAIVCPDTSPRGSDFPGEHDSYDFGSGAGFYVNATQQPWSAHYHMYDYVTQELPALVNGPPPKSTPPLVVHVTNTLPAPSEVTRSPSSSPPPPNRSLHRWVKLASYLAKKMSLPI